MNKEQLAQEYADTIRQKKRLTIAQWRYVYAAFLAALNLELAMDTAPKDGTEILVKDALDWWVVSVWSTDSFRSSETGNEINNPQCWRPL